MAFKVFEIFGEVGPLRGGRTMRRDVDQMTDRTRSKFRSTFTAIGKASLAATAAVTAVAGAGLLAAGKMAADFEQTQIAFTSLLGSAEAGADFLKELEDFGRRTPFELEQLEQASKLMLAFGFESESILPTLEIIGDATSALGSGGEGIERVVRALGQMSAKGKVSSQEMLQLTEAGIGAWELLANSIGVSIPEVQDMVSKGLIPVDDAIQGILDGLKQDFGGLMALQAETAIGKLSNLQDTFTAIGRKVGGPVVEAVKPLFDALLAITEDIDIEGLGQQFSNLTEPVSDFFTLMADSGLEEAMRIQFGSEMTDGVLTLGDSIAGIGESVMGFFGSFDDNTAETTLLNIIESLNNVANGVSAIIEIAAGLEPVWGPILDKLLEKWDFVNTAVEGFVKLLQGDVPGALNQFEVAVSKFIDFLGIGPQGAGRTSEKIIDIREGKFGRPTLPPLETSQIPGSPIIINNSISTDAMSAESVGRVVERSNAWSVRAAADRRAMR